MGWSQSCELKIVSSGVAHVRPSLSAPIVLNSLAERTGTKAPSASDEDVSQGAAGTPSLVRYGAIDSEERGQTSGIPRLG